MLLAMLLVLLLAVATVTVTTAFIVGVPAARKLLGILVVSARTCFTTLGPNFGLPLSTWTLVPSLGCLLVS